MFIIYHGTGLLEAMLGYQISFQDLGRDTINSLLQVPASTETWKDCGSSSLAELADVVW